jgi:hypothetical protein
MKNKDYLSVHCCRAAKKGIENVPRSVAQLNYDVK